VSAKRTNGSVFLPTGQTRGFARDLEDAGIPKHRIVLAFRAPSIRKHTEYAVG
jgi:hypothetical protein